MGDPARKNELARSSDRLVGSYAEPEQANARLRHAQSHYHLVSPAASVGTLPEGCEVALSMVQVDLGNETYDVGGGKYGLAKSVLDRIAASLGLSWDPQLSGRVDDGRDPHYCRYRVVGRYRAFDGQHQVIQGDKEMDLREGSAQVTSMWDRYERARKDSRRKYPPKEPTAQISEMRLHILSHAETKARLRAIRSLGLRTSYTEAELTKPFLAARIMFTGRTNDPELRREFGRMTAASFMGGVHGLYGATSPGVQAQVPALPQPERVSAPPVGSVPADDEEDFIEVPDAPDEQPPPLAASKPELAPAPRANGHTIYGGKGKPRVPIGEAADKDLEYWARRIGKDLEEGSSRKPEADQELHNAIVAELESRAQREEGAAPGDDGRLFPDEGY